MQTPLSPALSRMVDPQGRPYFLWDTDMPLATFQERLRDPDVEVRAYLVGKQMRQAKPDDVFTFVSLEEIAELWPQLERYLGKSPRHEAGKPRHDRRGYHQSLLDERG
jgi:hypothetical protein